MIEKLDGEKIVSRKKGITTVVCTSALPAALETPEVQFLSLGDKARLAGNAQCRKAETSVRPCPLKLFVATLPFDPPGLSPTCATALLEFDYALYVFTSKRGMGTCASCNSVQVSNQTNLSFILLMRPAWVHSWLKTSPWKLCHVRHGISDVCICIAVRTTSGSACCCFSLSSAMLAML